MALLARIAASGVSHAYITATGVSTMSLLLRSSSAAMQHCSGWSTPGPQATGSGQYFSSQSPSSVSAQSHFWLHQQHQHQQRLGLVPSISSSSSVGDRGISSSAALNSQCDCPTLGGPTPDIVQIEYDEDEVDRFIALADAIEEAYPNVVVEGNPTGPGRPGSFEVTLPDGAVLFSKLNSGGWPQAETVVESIGASAACGLPQQ